jgi:hypothetical protein
MEGHEIITAHLCATNPASAALSGELRSGHTLRKFEFIVPSGFDFQAWV